MTSRVLVIGLDSLDTSLLHEWIGDGLLPNLGALRDSGLSGPMHSFPGVFAGATWPSFATGRSPARHRRFFRQQAREGDYAETPFGTTDVVGPFFWERLGQAGKRVAVLDAPLTPMVPIDNGLNLVDWAAHEPSSPLPQASSAKVLEDLKDRFGCLAPDRCDSIGGTPDGTRKLLKSLLRRVENKCAVSSYCLNKDNWDLFVTVFGESHCVGHHGWHLHDPLHPKHDADLKSALGDPVKEVYKALDAAVGELVAMAGDDAITIVVNGEGIGPIYGAAGVLDEILWRLEAQPMLSRGQMFRRLKRLWWSLPASLRSSAPLDLAKRYLHEPLQTSALIPGRRDRRCYAMSNNDSGGAIRINLKGRQSNGCVDPGDDYDQLCDFVRHELLALEDPETHEPVVRRVHRTTDLMSGPYLSEMPDLLVEWTRHRPRSVSSQRIGSIALPPPGGRSGDHLNEGFCLLSGSGIEGGRWTEPRMITDVAPTVGALLGVTLDDLEGTAMPDIHPRGSAAGLVRAG